MSPQHTPGPWYIAGPTQYLNQLRIGPCIGVIYGAGKELEANASLIAAAPDLLEALKAQERHEWAKRNLESIGADVLHQAKLALVMEVERTGHEANAARKAAIAKAEGGQP